ncbi:hypothetical protein LPJ61_001822 [Coemansia biformis]|uniref:Zn(2)-C6 fungal-type domain-containing protein n=1 Tax=Coemansia biformis TaxID=1286918 RepID=A0A9W7YEG0_9FUNG|nr:hypothetical protein LPJ61_001822 [Coemansia biformis]
MAPATGISTAAQTGLAADAHSDVTSDSTGALRDIGLDDDDVEDDDDDLFDDEQNKQPRLMRACDHCRRKKIKCNGSRPACTHCLRMRLECHYSPLVRKKRTRRSIIDKLQERLLSMEQMLQPLVERLAPNDPVVCPGPGGFGPGFGFAPAPQLSIAHPLGYPLQQPPPPPAYMSALGPQAISRDLLHPSPAPPVAAPSDPPPPPAAVVEELLEVAMSRMTPTAPPVSWTRLLRRLHSGRLPEFIIYAAIGLAARFSTRPEFACTPRYNAGGKYARRAAELVSGLIDKPDPDVVFCLIMLSMYDWGCGRGESAWTYMGMATRLAQRCRLHLVDEEEFTENVDEQSRSWANAEWRRRLWWHVYCGDRASVIVASRPATMHDEDFVVDLPSHDHEWIAGTLPGSGATVEPSPSSACAGLPASPSSAAAPRTTLKKRLPDSWWLIVELYRICGRVSEFANRRRRPVRSGGISRRKMFEILDCDLENVRSQFIPGMEFPPRSDLLFNGFARLADGSNGMHNISAVFFNAHLMYHAAKIILYRSELPEYQHEEPSTDHIARAKAVCVDSAHAQADIIRWALDNVPVEDWDPMVGVWSLQGASIHVNTALSADSVLAEPSRHDLEVHLKLHVSADQYYHFNMAIVTMLHHVFDLRKKQRLAIDSADAATNGDVLAAALAQDGHQVVVRHRNDPDPWIVPRCSSFLGFSYTHRELHRSLNNAIKQTTYNPPEMTSEAGYYPGAQHQDTRPAGCLDAAATLSAPPSRATAAPIAMPDISMDLSGGLGVLPSTQTLPGEVHPRAGASTDRNANRISSSSSSTPATSELQRLAKRSFGSASGPGTRRNGANGAAGSEAEQQEQLQRLEDLRARVFLLQQLSNNQAGPPAPASAEAMRAAEDGMLKDAGGFLTSFAESIGSMASQLGAAGAQPAPVTRPGQASCPTAAAPLAAGSAMPTYQQSGAGGAWAPGGPALDGALLSTADSEELQRIVAQLQLATLPVSGPPGAEQAIGASGPLQLAPGLGYTAEDIMNMVQGMPTFPREE